MRRWGRVALALAALLGCASPRVAPQPRRAMVRPLRVLLYPYIPEAEALGAALERAFEARHPDIDLQRLAASDYYGAALPRADVYELDTLLLADLVVAGQVQPLPDSLVLPRLEPLGAAAGYVSGQRYGAPRWLCALFLFHRAGDQAIAAAATVEALPPAGLVADLVGASTLGELYLWGMGGIGGIGDRGQDQPQGTLLDEEVVERLQRLAAVCPPLLCRSEARHQRPGEHGRAFARGQGRALLGYAEALHAVLDEALRCAGQPGCLQAEDLRVRAPILQKGGRAPSFVDALALDRGCQGECRADAVAWLRFLLSAEAYRLALVPERGAAPRYLLPAVAAVYEDPRVLRAAPLYPVLRGLLGDAPPAAATPGQNARLRRLGQHLEQRLPPRAP